MNLLKTLTKQERKVLAQLAQGKSNRVIAQALVLSESTVENYVHRIFWKLGVRNRTQAVIYVLLCVFGKELEEWGNTEEQL